MFPLVEEHAGHRIERRPPGFEFTPGLLGKITTFVAVGPDAGLTVFAFMYSFLVTGGPLADEQELSSLALEAVRGAIDAGAATGGERTYELSANGWREVSRPSWWISVSAP